MQTIDSYQSTVGSLLRLVLQGPPKQGKTCVALQFPGAYVVDIDLNLGGPLRYLEKNHLPMPVGFDVIDKDETGKEIPISNRYTQLNKCLLAAQVHPDVKTIIIDSATNLVPILIAEVLRQQMKPAMTKQLWGFFYTLGYQFFSTITSMRKHIVLIAHEKINKDDGGAIVLPYEVAWPGQLGTNIGSFFTDVWRCEVIETPSGANSVYKWQIRTMPNQRFKLGNSLDLPPVFEFKWDTIKAKLDLGAK